MVRFIISSYLNKQMQSGQPVAMCVSTKRCFLCKKMFLPNTIIRRGMGVMFNRYNLSDDAPVPFAFLCRNELFEGIFSFLWSYSILSGHGGIFFLIKVSSSHSHALTKKGFFVNLSFVDTYGATNRSPHTHQHKKNIVFLRT